MPLYKMNCQIGDGQNVLLVNHVYELTDDFAAVINEERGGGTAACEPYAGPLGSGENAGIPAHREPEGVGPLKGDAWRAKGEEKKRIGTGI